jgi:hypothetical protein
VKALLQHVWHGDDGVLSFEWVLLLTLLTIGIVSGLTGARDAMIDELGDVAHAAICLDQSYFISGVSLTDPDITAPEQRFDDSKPCFEADGRTHFCGQPGENDGNG